MRRWLLQWLLRRRPLQLRPHHHRRRNRRCFLPISGRRRRASQLAALPRAGRTMLRPNVIDSIKGILIAPARAAPSASLSYQLSTAIIRRQRPGSFLHINTPRISPSMTSNLLQPVEQLLPALSAVTGAPSAPLAAAWLLGNPACHCHRRHRDRRR